MFFAERRKSAMAKREREGDAAAIAPAPPAVGDTTLANDATICPVCCRVPLAVVRRQSVSCPRCEYTLDAGASGIDANEVLARIRRAVVSHGSTLAAGECGAAAGATKFSTAGPLGPMFHPTGAAPLPCDDSAATAAAQLGVVWRPLLDGGDAACLLWVVCDTCHIVEVVV